MDNRDDLIINNEMNHIFKCFEENTWIFDKNLIKIGILLGDLSRKAYKVEIDKNIKYLGRILFKENQTKEKITKINENDFSKINEIKEIQMSRSNLYI